MPRLFRVVVALLALTAAVLMAGVLLRFALPHHAPFRMTLRPASGRTELQFTQPDGNLESEIFVVDLPLAEPLAIDLVSDESPAQGVIIEFADATLLPGRFCLHIGNSKFDVMVRAILVDGDQHEWRRR